MFNSSTNSFSVSYDNKFNGPIPSTYCRNNLLYFNMPELSPDSCYPICLFDKLNSNYLQNNNHCIGPEDKALYDLSNSTNLGVIVQNYNQQKNTISTIIKTPHPLPYFFQDSEIVSVPNANSYTVSMNSNGFKCDMPPKDLVQICPIAVSTGQLDVCAVNDTKNCFNLDCSSKPVTIEGGSLLYIYKSQNNFYTRSGFIMLITASITYNGWKCKGDLAVGYCDWTGISCFSGSVYKLALSGLGVVGIIPSSISLLSNLQILDLKYNQFDGSIPRSIIDLISLTTLDLSNNRLKGSIPSEVSHLVKLVNCNFANNQLTGTLPANLSNIKTLKSFIVNENDLTGQISASLCLLSENVLLQVTGNPGIGCYIQCNSDTNSLESQLPICLPTQSPTVTPLSTTNTNKTLIIIISVCIGGSALLIILFVYLYYRRKSKKYYELITNSKIEMNEKKKILGRLTIHSSILSFCETKSKLLIDYMSELEMLLENHPDTIGQMDYNGRTVIDLVLQFYRTVFTDEVVLLLLQKWY